MINEIFTQMKWYGWNLGDNNNEDFEEVYKRHYKNLIKWFDYIVDSNYDFDMKDINKIEFEQFVDFISDFLTALNDRTNYVEKLENGLINALDELSQKSEKFDYYDKLSELTNMQNSEVLDLLDKFSDNEE